MTLVSLRQVSGLAGVALFAQAIALGIILMTSRAHLTLPITVDLPTRPSGASQTSARILLSQLDPGVGVVVLCALVAVVRLIVVLPHSFSRYVNSVQSNRHATRWIEFAFSSSITIFLVAQLNGITDIGALVLSYAITSGMTLFSVLQERSDPPGTKQMLPLWFGAAVGIVPWGVVAFHQVGALIEGNPPTVIVRVITLMMLSFSFSFAIAHWREQRQVATRQSLASGERTHILLSLASTSLFAWVVVLGVVVSGARADY